MEVIRNEAKNVAEFYSQRIQDWLCLNYALYPLYTQPQTAIKPTRPNFDGGIYYGRGTSYDPTFYSFEDETGCC